MNQLVTTIRWKDATKESPLVSGNYFVYVRGELTKRDWNGHAWMAWAWGVQSVVTGVTHFALPSDITTEEVK